MKTKHVLKGKILDRSVWLDNVKLNPYKSQKIINHSPNGFAWGYGGSGPSQLALAIMLKLTGKSNYYQALKWALVAKLPETDFEVIFEFPDNFPEETISILKIKNSINN